jgi:hypothetical protein
VIFNVSDANIIEMCGNSLRLENMLHSRLCILPEIKELMAIVGMSIKQRYYLKEKGCASFK